MGKVFLDTVARMGKTLPSSKQLGADKMMQTPNLTAIRPNPADLKIAFIPVDSATYLQGAYLAVAFQPDSHAVVSVDMYSSLHAARLNGTSGLIAEDFQDSLTGQQLKSIELKITELELAKDLAARALKDEVKRSKAVA